MYNGKNGMVMENPMPVMKLPNHKNTIFCCQRAFCIAFTSINVIAIILALLKEPPQVTIKKQAY